jgi:hypothetical protein
MRRPVPGDDPSPSRQLSPRGATASPPSATAGATAADVDASAGSDPDLALLIERWGDLPEPVKAGIMAMVRAGKSDPLT